MPASPFGIAYGIGAGLANAPEAMRRAQLSKNTIAMQDIQRKMVERQMAEAQANDQVLSEPVAPEMQAPTTQQSMQNLLGARPSTGEGGIPLGLGTVNQGPSPTLSSAMAPVAHEYMSPHEKTAYEYGQRAKKLADMGFGSSSMAFQKEASRYAGLAADDISVKAAKFLNQGDSAAIPYLKKIGFTDTVEVGRAKDGTPWVKDSHGNTTPVEPSDLALIIGNGANALSGILARMGTDESRARARAFSDNMHKEIELSKMEQQKEQKAQDWENRFKLAKEAMPYRMRGVAGTADIQNVAAMVHDLKISPEEAWGKLRRDSGAVNDSRRLQVLTKRNSEIWRLNDGAPRETDPSYNEYMDNTRKINALMDDEPRSRVSSPSSQRGKPGSKLGITISGNGGRITASTNPKYPVGMIARNPNGQTIKDGSY